MKRIEAIIRPYKQEQVLKALGQLGSYGVSVTEALSAGSDTPESDLYQSVTQGKDLVPRLVLTLHVRDEEVEKVVKVIADNAHSGKVGDGKIAVMPVDNLLKIRTGQQGEEAL